MSSEIENWKLGLDCEDLIRILQTHIEDKEVSIRLSAVLGILLITVLEPSFSEKLITYLKSLVINDDSYIRGSAALSLGIIGATISSDPIPYLDMLKLLLFDETRFVQRNASVGLAFISSTTVTKEKRFQLLEELLSSAFWYFRVGGALGMGCFCDPGEVPETVEKLKPILNDSDVDVRIGAIYGLGIIAKKFSYTKYLIPMFKSCLFDYDSAVVLSAKVVLTLLEFP